MDGVYGNEEQHHRNLMSIFSCDMINKVPSKRERCRIFELHYVGLFRCISRIQSPDLSSSDKRRLFFICYFHKLVSV